MPEPPQAPPLHEEPQHTCCNSYRDDYAVNRAINGGNTDDNYRENNAVQYWTENHSPSVSIGCTSRTVNLLVLVVLEPPPISN